MWISLRSLAHGLFFFLAVNSRADWRNLKTKWIVDQLRILVRIPNCTCLDVRTLGPKRNLDHRSSFCLGRYVEFIQSISFFEQSSFKLLELYCVRVVKHAAFFTICAKLTMTFTFSSSPTNFYTFVPWCRCGFVFREQTNILTDRRIWREKVTHRRICTPLLTCPLPNHHSLTSLTLILWR